MTIPLGASIGCVVAPDEGIDFSELKEKADKALYAVKKNGKHGFIFYADLAQKEKKLDSPTGSLSNTVKILSERNRSKGALMLPYEQFRVVYQFMSRFNTSHHSDCMILFSVKAKENASASVESALDEFIRISANSLRQTDVLTKNGNSQCIVILSETSMTNVNPVTERILRNWSESEFSDMFEISFECGMLV